MEEIYKLKYKEEGTGLLRCTRNDERENKIRSNENNNFPILISF